MPGCDVRIGMTEDLLDCSYLFIPKDENIEENATTLQYQHPVMPESHH